MALWCRIEYYELSRYRCKKKKKTYFYIKSERIALEDVDDSSAIDFARNIRAYRKIV